MSILQYFHDEKSAAVVFFCAQHGDTPLHISCKNNHGDAVEALILAYADMNLRNKV